MGEVTWAVIANPAAGGGVFKSLRKSLEAQLRKQGIQYDLFKTEDKLHAVKLVEDLASEGYRHFASVGGDGTHNEVVNGIMQQSACPANELTFAALPAGTGNDWIKEHNIPNKLAGSVALLKRGRTRSQSVGSIRFEDSDRNKQQRYFMNVAGAAYDAEVVYGLLNRKGKKSRLIYLIEGLRKLAGYRPKAAEISMDDKSWSGKLFTFHAGICRYSGDGMAFVPHADPFSGMLACTILPYAPLPALLRQVPSLYNGKIRKFPGAECHLAGNVALNAEERIAIEADGEFLGYSPFMISIMPGALKIIALSGKER